MINRAVNREHQITEGTMRLIALDLAKHKTGMCGVHVRPLPRHHGTCASPSRRCRWLSLDAVGFFYGRLGAVEFR